MLPSSMSPFDAGADGMYVSEASTALLSLPKSLAVCSKLAEDSLASGRARQSACQAVLNSASGKALVHHFVKHTSDVAAALSKASADTHTRHPTLEVIVPLLVDCGMRWGMTDPTTATTTTSSTSTSTPTPPSPLIAFTEALFDRVGGADAGGDEYGCLLVLLGVAGCVPQHDSAEQQQQRRSTSKGPSALPLVAELAEGLGCDATTAAAAATSFLPPNADPCSATPPSAASIVDALLGCSDRITHTISALCRQFAGEAPGKSTPPEQGPPSRLQLLSGQVAIAWLLVCDSQAEPRGGSATTTTTTTSSSSSSQSAQESEVLRRRAWSFASPVERMVRTARRWFEKGGKPLLVVACDATSFALDKACEAEKLDTAIRHNAAGGGGGGGGAAPRPTLPFLLLSTLMQGVSPHPQPARFVLEADAVTRAAAVSTAAEPHPPSGASFFDNQFRDFLAKRGVEGEADGGLPAAATPAQRIERDCLRIIAALVAWEGGGGGGGAASTPLAAAAPAPLAVITPGFMRVLLSAIPLGHHGKAAWRQLLGGGGAGGGSPPATPSGGGGGGGGGGSTAEVLCRACLGLLERLPAQPGGGGGAAAAGGTDGQRAVLRHEARLARRAVTELLGAVMAGARPAAPAKGGSAAAASLPPGSSAAVSPQSAADFVRATGHPAVAVIAETSSRQGAAYAASVIRELLPHAMLEQQQHAHQGEVGPCLAAARSIVALLQAGGGKKRAKRDRQQKAAAGEPSHASLHDFLQQADAAAAAAPCGGGSPQALLAEELASLGEGLMQRGGGGGGGSLEEVCSMLAALPLAASLPPLLARLALLPHGAPGRAAVADVAGAVASEGGAGAAGAPPLGQSQTTQQGGGGAAAAGFSERLRRLSRTFAKAVGGGGGGGSAPATPHCPGALFAFAALQCIASAEGRGARCHGGDAAAQQQHPHHALPSPLPLPAAAEAGEGGGEWGAAQRLLRHNIRCGVAFPAELAALLLRHSREAGVAYQGGGEGGAAAAPSPAPHPAAAPFGMDPSSVSPRNIVMYARAVLSASDTSAAHPSAPPHHRDSCAFLLSAGKALCAEWGAAVTCWGVPEGVAAVEGPAAAAPTATPAYPFACRHPTRAALLCSILFETPDQESVVGVVCSAVSAARGAGLPLFAAPLSERLREGIESSEGSEGSGGPPGAAAPPGPAPGAAVFPHLAALLICRALPRAAVLGAPPGLREALFASAGAALPRCARGGAARRPAAPPGSAELYADLLPRCLPACLCPAGGAGPTHAAAAAFPEVMRYVEACLSGSTADTPVTDGVKCAVALACRGAVALMVGCAAGGGGGGGGGGAALLQAIVLRTVEVLCGVGEGGAGGIAVFHRRFAQQPRVVMAVHDAISLACAAEACEGRAGGSSQKQGLLRYLGGGGSAAAAGDNAFYALLGEASLAGALSYLAKPEMSPGGVPNGFSRAVVAWCVQGGGAVGGARLDLLFNTVFHWQGRVDDEVVSSLLPVCLRASREAYPAGFAGLKLLGSLLGKSGDAALGDADIAQAVAAIAPLQAPGNPDDVRGLASQLLSILLGGGGV